MSRVLDIDVAFEHTTGECEFFDIMYGDFQQEAFERISIFSNGLMWGRKRCSIRVMLENPEQTIVEIRGSRNDTIQRCERHD